MKHLPSGNILITGSTGSGKSNLSVRLILGYLSEGRKVFSNIKLNLDHANYFYLDELNIRKYLEFIEDQFIQVDSLEDKKKEMENTPYFGAVFFIDEAHAIGFDALSKGIRSWLNFRRHFHQDVFIITPQLDDIHPKYKRVFHRHIELVDQKSRPQKDLFGYKIFEGVGGVRLETTFYKPDPSHFDIYKTGKNEGEAHPYVKKAVLLLASVLVGLGLLIWFIFFVGHRLSSKVDPNQVTVNDPVNVSKSAGLVTFTGSKYLSFTCIDSICKNDVYDLVLDLKDLNTLLSSSNSKLIGFQSLNDHYSVFSLMATSTFINYFLKDKEHAKNNISSGVAVF